MSERKSAISRRLFLVRTAAALATTTALATTVRDSDSGSDSVGAPEQSTPQLNDQIENPLIAQITRKATSFVSRILKPTATVAKACHFESGPHKCGGTCPNEWVGNVTVSAFVYKENANKPMYDKFDKDVDEVWTTIPKGGRKMRLILWGCDVEPTPTIWISEEDGDGRAHIEGKADLSLTVRKHGTVEPWNWRDGIDKQTGKPAKIAFIRGQIDRFDENGVDTHREINPNSPFNGQLSRWQVCIDICPEGVTPVEKTDIFVASGLRADEIAKRGYAKKNGMYVPQYASTFDRVPEDK